MARYSTTVRTPRPPDEAFAYMADLRNFALWDPGVTRVTQVHGEGGGPTSVFDVVVRSVVGGTTLQYVTTRYDEPRSVQVEARSSLLTSIDRIDVVADSEGSGTGSLVTYDAELRLNGPLGVFDLGLKPVFKRIGDRAAAGLARALEGERVGR
jgi:carbon monoxide dehydrogenase subunit G